MQFDTILKTLFQSPNLALLELLTDAPVREWINVEIPKAQMNKLDLVAWLTNGCLYHLKRPSTSGGLSIFTDGLPDSNLAIQLGTVASKGVPGTQRISRLK